MGGVLGTPPVRRQRGERRRGPDRLVGLRPVRMLHAPHRPGLCLQQVAGGTPRSPRGREARGDRDQARGADAAFDARAGRPRRDLAGGRGRRGDDARCIDARAVFAIWRGPSPERGEAAVAERHGPSRARSCRRADAQVVDRLAHLRGESSRSALLAPGCGTDEIPIDCRCSATRSSSSPSW